MIGWLLLWAATAGSQPPPLPADVTVFAGETHRFTVACEVASSRAHGNDAPNESALEVKDAARGTTTTSLRARRRGRDVLISASSPGEFTVAVGCERVLHVHVRPLPDLFQLGVGADRDDLPSLPSKLELFAGETRDFRPGCKVASMRGRGDAVETELLLIRVLQVHATGKGSASFTLTCEDGREQQVDVTVLGGS